MSLVLLRQHTKVIPIDPFWVGWNSRRYKSTVFALQRRRVFASLILALMLVCGSKLTWAYPARNPIRLLSKLDSARS
jgi:hypothetical protein